MRRTVLLISAVATMIVVAAGVALSAVLVGNLGSNTQRGTANADRIYGLDGVDTQRGGGGNDYLEGGAGADDQFGGSGKDTILGGLGSDSGHGGAGDDILNSLDGVTSNDELIGGDGDRDLCVFDEGDVADCEIEVHG